MRLLIRSATLFFLILFCSVTSIVHASPVVKDRDGQVVGGFVGWGPQMSGTFETGSSNDYLLISRTGYIFFLKYAWSLRFNPDFFYGTNATIRAFTNWAPISYAEKVFFETSDCSGTSYITEVQSGIVTNSILSQEQIWTDELAIDTLYYVPKGKMPVILTPQSHLALDENNNIVCQVIDTTEQQVLIEALPNDPAVTGVHDSKFPLPVYFDFDYRFGTPEVFIDRFISSD